MNELPDPAALSQGRVSARNDLDPDGALACARGDALSTSPVAARVSRGIIGKLGERVDWSEALRRMLTFHVSIGQHARRDQLDRHHMSRPGWSCRERGPDLRRRQADRRAFRLFSGCEVRRSTPSSWSRLGYAGLLALQACSMKPALTPDVARERILAHLPPGWTVAQDVPNSYPFEQHPNDARPLGEKLVLVGPAAVLVSGYYCDGAFCENQGAREALEIWIMPAGYHDDGPGESMMAERAPDRIYRDGQTKIFAMTSRLLDSGQAYDADVTSESREASTLGAPPKDDALALSWRGWRSDVQEALDGA